MARQFCIYLCKNDLVNQQNRANLEKLEGEIEILKAIHIHPHQKNFKAKINKDGYVNDTPFLNEIQLKTGARIMLTYNIDTADGLTNGTTGIVLGFVKVNDRVKYVLMEVDDRKYGQASRKKYALLLNQCGMPQATPIKKLSFEYNLGKSKKHHTAKAKVIQFPITLAWALTAHKCQGQTIKDPASMVADLTSCFEAGQAYVILGRIQNLSQLYLKSFVPKKIYANPKALQETKTMHEAALNNPVISRNIIWNRENKFHRKIISLNIQNLPTHLDDIKSDSTFLKSDIICFQETFCEQSHGIPVIPGYICNIAGSGKGKGVATFVRNEISLDLQNTEHVELEFAQCIKLQFKDYDLITIYRPYSKINLSYTEQLTNILFSIVQ